MVVASRDSKLLAIAYVLYCNVMQSIGPVLGSQYGVDQTTGVTFTAGVTYEIRVVVESNQMAVYVDGALVGTESGPATYTAAGAKVYVGDPWYPAAKVTLSDIYLKEIAAPTP